MQELYLFLQKNRLEAGCDEAGRGCLAGPVVAAAVILDPKKVILGLNDSKKLNEKQRLVLKDEIINKALSFGIGVVEVSEIDKINILNASILAMHKAISQLKISPDFLLIDGNRFHPYLSIPHETIVKGDAKFQSIAAASILAKTHRDYLMKCLHQEYSGYDWQTNKGYPTLKHRNAIKSLGISIHHRKTFRLIEKNSQLNLFN
jgi:ribonuclease HII